MLEKTYLLESYTKKKVETKSLHRKYGSTFIPFGAILGTKLYLYLYKVVLNQQGAILWTWNTSPRIHFCSIYFFSVVIEALLVSIWLPVWGITIHYPESNWQTCQLLRSNTHPFSFIYMIYQGNVPERDIWALRKTICSTWPMFDRTLSVIKIWPDIMKFS